MNEEKGSKKTIITKKKDPSTLPHRQMKSRLQILRLWLPFDTAQCCRRVSGGAFEISLSKWAKGKEEEAEKEGMRDVLQERVAPPSQRGQLQRHRRNLPPNQVRRTG